MTAADPFGIVALVEEEFERCFRRREEWSAAQAFKNAMIFGDPVIVKSETEGRTEGEMADDEQVDPCRLEALSKAIECAKVMGDLWHIDTMLLRASRFEDYLRTGATGVKAEGSES